MNFRKKMLKAATGMFLLLSVVFAAEGVEKLTLDEAVQIALEKNFDVLMARTELERTEGSLISAQAGYYPSLDLSGSSTRREDSGSSPERVNNVAVTLSQTLYAGGTIHAGKRQALVDSQKAGEELGYAMDTVTQAVCNAWYGVLQKEADLRTAEEASLYYANAWMDIKKRVELGLSTKLELVRADQERASAEADLSSAKNELAKARISLLTLLRIDPETEVEIDGRLEMVEVEGDVKLSIETALSSRSDLQALISEEASRKEAVDIAEGGLKPTVKLAASYEFNDTSSSSASSNADEWVAKLTVNIPVSDGGYTKGQVKSKKALQEQAQQSIEQKKDAIKEETLSAWMTLVSSVETTEAAKKNVDLARESLHLAEVGYREGVNTQLDVLQARTSLTEALQKLSSSLKEHNLAFVALRMAEGTLTRNFEGGE